MHRKALVLGGGAPNFTLMTGALLALDEAGVTFDVVSMAGGGSVVGLTYLAPKGLDRRDALKNSVNAGIADPIYDVLPMNYKIFTKPGRSAARFRRMLSRMPGYQRVVNQYGMSKSEKLLSDWTQAVWAMMCPSDLTPYSKGLCAHAPFIEGMVDFDKLKTVDADFYLNAYCLTDHQMAIFDRHQVDLRHFQACLSFPFMYAPTEIDGKLYIEGAARDAFNFKALVEREPEIKTFVVFDIMGIEGLIHPPRSLWDAYGQSIIAPLVALSRADLKLFEVQHNTGPEKRRLLKIHYDIPPEWMEDALDWSSSNLNRLFEVGYKAGQAFVRRHGADLAGD